MHFGVGIEHFSCSKVVRYQRDLCGVSYNSHCQYNYVLSSYVGDDKEAKGQGIVTIEVDVKCVEELTFFISPLGKKAECKTSGEIICFC